MRDRQQLFELTQLQMSDAELIEKAYKEIHELARTYGDSHHMTIPPSVNDTDMILSELVRRYEKVVAEENSAQCGEPYFVDFLLKCVESSSIKDYASKRNYELDSELKFLRTKYERLKDMTAAAEIRSLKDDLGVLFSGYSDSPQAVHKDVIKEIYQIFERYER